MATQIVVKPTFLLKGIDPFHLAKEYRQGRVLANLSLTGKRIAPVTLVSNRGHSFRDGIYTFRNKDNFVHTIATTQAKDFIFFDQHGKIIEGGVCNNCMKEFNHRGLGIPVSLREDGERLLIGTIRTTHGFRCCLRLIITLQQRLSKFRDVDLEHSEQLLKFIYRKMYPNHPPLRAAPDPYLHERNHGSLTEEEYDDDRYVYIPTHNLIIHPIKEQYLRISS